MKAVLDAVLPSLLPLLATALVSATGWVAFHLGAFLHQKAASSKAFAALEVLTSQALGIVQDIENSEKAAIIAKGGALTSADAVQLKQLAIDRLKKDLGESGLATLQKALEALLGATSLDTFMSGKIEQAVATVSK